MRQAERVAKESEKYDKAVLSIRKQILGPTDADLDGCIRLGFADGHHVSVEDTIGLYLRDTREVHQGLLLTHEQEIWLGTLVGQGHQAKLKLDRGRGMKPGKRQEYIAQHIQGRAAADTLVLFNTRLVIPIARRRQGLGLPFMDLVQEGNIGLIRAAAKYEPVRGYRFATYATWWIISVIDRATSEQGPLITMSRESYTDMQKVVRTFWDLYQEFHRDPTPQELAGALHTDTKRICELLRYNQRELSIKSLQRPADPHRPNSLPLEEILEASSLLPSPTDKEDQYFLNHAVSEILVNLTEHHARLLADRFGIDAKKGMTFKQMGKKYGVTPQAAQLRLARAVKAVRGDHSSMQKLKQFDI